MAGTQAIDNRLQADMFSEFYSTIFLLISSHYYYLSDKIISDLDSGLLAKTYQDDPSIVILSNHIDIDNKTINISFDLLHHEPRTILYPGQSNEALFVHNLLGGMTTSSAEQVTLQTFAGGMTFSESDVTQIFLSAKEQGIRPVLVVDTEILSQLDLSNQAKARIISALDAGKLVVVPEHMVLIGDKLTIGWWETDPKTGKTLSMGENGHHSPTLQFLVEGAFTKFLTWAAYAAVGVIVGAIVTIATLEVITVFIAQQEEIDNPGIGPREAMRIAVGRVKAVLNNWYFDATSNNSFFCFFGGGFISVATTLPSGPGGVISGFCFGIYLGISYY
jgi:hypothetical protein